MFCHVEVAGEIAVIDRTVKGKAVWFIQIFCNSFSIIGFAVVVGIFKRENFTFSRLAHYYPTIWTKLHVSCTSNIACKDVNTKSFWYRKSLG